MRKLFLLAMFLSPLSIRGQVVVGNGLVQYVTSAPSGSCSQNAPMQIVFGPGTIYTCQTNTWAQISGGGGGVTSVGTTSPITGGTITTTGTIACASCVTSSSPGAGIAHFAGSTQAVTSSAIVAADITNATITGTQIASSVALAGSPTTTTQAASDNSTKIATTAYVDRNASAMVQLESHAASASATLDFTTCFQSSYHAYRFIIKNLVPTTNNDQLYDRVGTGVGPTYDTGSNYAYNDPTFSAGGLSADGATSSTIMQMISQNISSTASLGGVSGTVDVFDPLNGATRTHANHHLGFWNGNGTSWQMSVGGESYMATTAVTAWRFFFSTGTIASGTITCYGLTP